MKKQVYAVDPGVDVYKIGEDILEFYFINTRRRITIQVTPAVIDLINAFDGKTPLEPLCNTIGVTASEDVIAFISYLLQEKAIYSVSNNQLESKTLTASDALRYDRQLNYFNSLYPGSAYSIQKKLQDETVLVFGVGAIGSGIALQLAMSGIRNFILIDKDLVSRDSIERHFWFKNKYLGQPKVDAFSDYLQSIDHQISCESHQLTIDYDTSLDEWINKSTFVINTLDEPYIGITSLKIGRACFAMDKPLYVAGGFDAHLMSTGELIIPRETPCIDCYTAFFGEELKNWKPQYNTKAITEDKLDQNLFEVGGLASMSLFSISYAVLIILNYLATGDATYSRGRGELLPDELKIHYLNISKNPNCHVCGNK